VPTGEFHASTLIVSRAAPGGIDRRVTDLEPGPPRPVHCRRGAGWDNYSQRWRSDHCAEGTWDDAPRHDWPEGRTRPYGRGAHLATQEAQASSGHPRAVDQQGVRGRHGIFHGRVMKIPAEDRCRLGTCPDSQPHRVAPSVAALGTAAGVVDGLDRADPLPPGAACRHRCAHGTGARRAMPCVRPPFVPRKAGPALCRRRYQLDEVQGVRRDGLPRADAGRWRPWGSRPSLGPEEASGAVVGAVISMGRSGRGGHMRPIRPVKPTHCRACHRHIDPSATMCPYCHSDGRHWAARQAPFVIVGSVLLGLFLAAVVLHVWTIVPR
jgi:hypothetical protein